MGPLVVFIVALLLLISFGAYTQFYRKDFLGTWKGQRLQIVYRYSSIDILIDDQFILQNIHTKHSQTLQCRVPLLGQKQIQLPTQNTSNQEIPSMTVLIDDESVLLTQAPLNFWGNTQLSSIEMIETQQQTFPTDDPRLHSAHNLYQSIKKEIGEDEETATLLQSMMTELVNHIEIERRIEASQSDYEALGSSQNEIQSTKEHNAQRIQMLLNGLQDIHLTVIQRTVISRENLSGDIQRILAKMEAQIEVDQGT